MKKIGIGYENFKDFTKEKLYYVDKTLLVRDILDKGGKTTLFTRPRRFGKTLALSMLRTFFELEYDREGNPIDKRPYFEGMKIKQTFHDIVWGELEWEKKRQSFSPEQDNEEFKKEVGRYAIALKTLSELPEAYHGKKVIILIDEYDVPLENAHFKGYYDKMVGFIRGVFENALKTNSSLEMAVLTGCLRVSKESLFTGLNNPQINSIQSGEFSEYFGFTEQEVRNMTEYFEIPEKFPVIKEWYDGYRFGITEIYNPWSVLNYLRDVRAIPDTNPVPYWSNTSSNSIIHQLIAEADEDTRDTIEELVNGGNVTVPVHENMVYADIKINRNDIWSFLLFTGYLKQVKSELRGNTIWLKMVIPNREVKSIYQQTIMQWFDENVRKTSRENLLKSLISGDVETVSEIIGEWLSETISFYDEKESYYHGFMSGLLSGFKGYKLRSNRESGDGRPDLLLMERNGRTAVILEFKIVPEGRTLNGMADEAVRQIEEDHYEEELLHDGYQNIIKYGIAFKQKKCLVKIG